MAFQMAYPYAVYRRKNDSKMMIVLGVLFVVFLMLCIAIVVAWAVLSDGFRNLGGLPDVCTSADCVSTASRLSADMDQYQRPCDNFYQYTCGKYSSQSGEGIKTRETDMLESTRNKLKVLLDKPLETVDSGSVQFAKKLYISCSDSNSRKLAGIQPLRDLLRNVPCGPIYKDCTNFNASYYSWERHAAMVAPFIGQRNVIFADRGVHPEDSRRVVLTIGAPDLSALIGPIESDLALSAHPNTDEYNSLLVTSVKQRLLNEPSENLLSADPSASRDLLSEVADFMISLHKAKLSSQVRITMRQDEYRSVVTLRTLASRFPEVDWTSFFNAELNTMLHMNDTDVVVIEDQFYFRTLATIIQRTPLRAIANYLTLMTAISLRDFLPTEFQSSSSTAAATSVSSWRLCVDQLMRFEPTVKLYVDNYLDFKQRNDIAMLASNIRSAFLKINVDNNEEVFNKTRDVVFKIAASSRILSDLSGAPFDKLNFQDSYFAVVVNAIQLQRIEDIKQIGTILQPDDSPRFPQMTATNIVYNAAENSIFVPVSALQPPVLLPGNDAPKYTIYATLGSLIAQALVRTVDDQPPTAIMNSTFACFEQMISMLYTGGVISSNMQTNSKIESWRTFTGLEAALQAYKQYLSKAQLQKEVPLPAFTKLSSMQQYFIAAANLACESNDQNNVVSSMEVRINAAVKNSVDFSRSFGCKREDRLQYEGKC